MYQCDISHVLSALQRHLPGLSQSTFFDAIFKAAIDDRRKWTGNAVSIDFGDLSKIFSGKKPLPKWIINYFTEVGIEALISSVHSLCSTMNTIDTLVDELYLYVQADPILGVDAKQRIIAHYPYALQDEKITFIATCLYSAILRPQQLLPVSDARLCVDHI